MKEIIAIIGNANKDDSWEEKLPIPDDADPKKYLEKMVNEFNAEELHRKKANPDYIVTLRRFVGIGNETGVRFCVMEKYNIVTIIKGMDSYDIMLCKVCKIFRKRIGLGQDFGNFKCEPDKTCIDCNKVFKTVKACQKHKEKGKHQEPSWLPDGV